MIIGCPWPVTQLRPNFIRGNHWSKVDKHIKAYRHTCWLLGLEQGAHLINWPKEPRSMTYTFHAPIGCRWDMDNREGAFKAGQDGIADAMSLDDQWFRPQKIHGKNMRTGCILVTIDMEGTGK